MSLRLVEVGLIVAALCCARSRLVTFLAPGDGRRVLVGEEPPSIARPPHPSEKPARALAADHRMLKAMQKEMAEADTAEDEDGMKAVMRQFVEMEVRPTPASKLEMQAQDEQKAKEARDAAKVRRDAAIQRLSQMPEPDGYYSPSLLDDISPSELSDWQLEAPLVPIDTTRASTEATTPDGDFARAQRDVEEAQRVLDEAEEELQLVSRIAVDEAEAAPDSLWNKFEEIYCGGWWRVDRRFTATLAPLQQPDASATWQLYEIVVPYDPATDGLMLPGASIRFTCVPGNVYTLPSFDQSASDLFFSFPAKIAKQTAIASQITIEGLEVSPRRCGSAASSVDPAEAQVIALTVGGQAVVVDNATPDPGNASSHERSAAKQKLRGWKDLFERIAVEAIAVRRRQDAARAEASRYIVQGDTTSLAAVLQLKSDLCSSREAVVSLLDQAMGDLPCVLALLRAADSAQCGVGQPAQLRQRGTEMLLAAASEGNVGALPLLQIAGFDCSHQQTGMTPLMVAAKAGRFDFVSQLLDRAPTAADALASLQQTDSFGDYTALKHAISSDHIKVAALLADRERECGCLSFAVAAKLFQDAAAEASKPPKKLNEPWARRGGSLWPLIEYCLRPGGVLRQKIPLNNRDLALEGINSLRTALGQPGVSLSDEDRVLAEYWFVSTMGLGYGGGASADLFHKRFGHAIISLRSAADRLSVIHIKARRSNGMKDAQAILMCALPSHPRPLFATRPPAVCNPFHLTAPPRPPPHIIHTASLARVQDRCRHRCHAQDTG